MNAGTFTAKVKDYGFRMSSTKKPMIVMQFEIEADGGTHTVYYQSMMDNDKSKEYVMDNLQTLGLSIDFSNPADYEKFNEGAGSGCLDETKEVSVVVELEEYKGKMNPKVKYINELGGGAIKNKMAKDELVSVMGGMNLASLAKKGESGGPVPF